MVVFGERQLDEILSSMNSQIQIDGIRRFLSILRKEGWCIVLPEPELPKKEMPSGTTEYSTNYAQEDLGLLAILHNRGYTLGDVRGTSRCRPLALCRREVYKYCRDTFNWSYPRIARFCNKDHSSVVYGIQMLEPPEDV